MAVDLDPALQDGDEDEGAVPMAEEDAPSHHPDAPPDELFDISTTVDPSYIISLIRKLIPNNQSNHRYVGGCNGSGDFQTSNMDITDKRVSSDRETECSPIKNSYAVENGDEAPGAIVGEECWEEHGCVLWDLAASRTHAELMVHNLVLDVLLANLMVSQSTRVIEICLGIIGNIACHEALLEHIASTNGLVQTIVDQLFLDDTQGLSEACRLLTLCLQGRQCIILAQALVPDHVIFRLVWIAENTLNPLLLERSVGLLLVILESEEGARPILLPPLVDNGLPKLLVSLLDYEISKLMDERLPERYPVLDIILRAIEALSTMDDHSKEISSNKELVQLVCKLVKLPDKMEIAESCVTTAVLIANMLSDIDNLAIEMSQDLPFLQGLFDILPLTSNEKEARNALWSVIAQLLAEIKESEIEKSKLYQYASVLASKFELIEEDLLDHQVIIADEHGCSTEPKSNATIVSLNRMISILKEWIQVREVDDRESASDKYQEIEVAVQRLLEFCHNYNR